MQTLFEKPESSRLAPAKAKDVVMRPGSDRPLFKRLVKLWHSHLPDVGKIGGSLNTYCAFYYFEYADHWFAVAGWSNPVARSLPQRTCLELRRFAIAPDAPKNLGSRGLALMAKDIWDRFPKVTRLISYQDIDVHAGTIYKAAGWEPVLCGSVGAWNNRRGNRSAIRRERKIRWELAKTSVFETKATKS